MRLRKWQELPANMKNDSVKKYYDRLYKKRCSLLVKRMTDLVFAVLIFLVLCPLFPAISIAIKMDSKGPALFRQVRVTQYGKRFRIFKFRTMVCNADKTGGQLTTNHDCRVTRVGRFLRKYRLDEIPQLLNILAGDMSFVGTRPEVEKYVEQYTNEMMATLLLPAGVTSEACIRYKTEDLLLTDDADRTYVDVVLPEKMKYNLKSLENFSLWEDMNTMVRTLRAVMK